MKRARDCGIVKLNVGGTVFHVAIDTLAGMSYFDPLRQGRFPWEMGEDGALFIDRDGGCDSWSTFLHRIPPCSKSNTAGGGQTGPNRGPESNGIFRHVWWNFSRSFYGAKPSLPGQNLGIRGAQRDSGTQMVRSTLPPLGASKICG